VLGGAEAMPPALVNVSLPFQDTELELRQTAALVAHTSGTPCSGGRFRNRTGWFPSLLSLLQQAGPLSGIERGKPHSHHKQSPDTRMGMRL